MDVSETFEVLGLLGYDTSLPEDNAGRGKWKVLIREVNVKTKYLVWIDSSISFCLGDILLISKENGVWVSLTNITQNETTSIRKVDLVSEIIKLSARDLDSISCGHCMETLPMKIVGYIEDKFNSGEILKNEMYAVLKCSSCNNSTVVYSMARNVEETGKTNWITLYPSNDIIPLGLPDKIFNAYLAAENVKKIDVNAYVILLRRLLEMVCIDRNAVGKTLAAMLEDLSKKNEIPHKLATIAKGLKDFGNIGAHVGIGELSRKEIPTITALCRAILEYIYSAPHLANLAESTLKEIKDKGKG